MTHSHRSAFILLALGATLALGGCGASDEGPREPSSDTAGSESEPVEAPAPRLVVAAFSILDAEGVGIEVSEDGAVAMAGRPVGRVRGDGTVVGADGDLAATLQEDGRLLSDEGELIVTVRPDATLVNLRGEELRWDEQGRMTLPRGALQLTPDDPALRRTASVVLFLSLGVRRPTVVDPDF